VNDYAEFLRAKSQSGAACGFKPVWLPDFLFDFQGSLVEWALWTGRAAIFADCGLGKTPMELVWAENMVRITGGRVLIAAPLAVAWQIAREAEKFGVTVTISRDGTAHPGITVTNYERLHLFTPSDFVAFVGDESSILKNFDGARRAEITVFMRQLPYRLLSTATAAPNDYIELGTTSEALGYLGHMDMLNRFFKNDLNNSAQGRMRGEVIKWRLKGHAEIPFWRYVCSWARAIRRPSDLGFDDSRFVLPALVEREHIVDVEQLAEGMLFALPAVGLKEQRDERRRSLTERCEKAAELMEPQDLSVAWVQLNDEGDELERLLPGAAQIKGSQSEDEREEIFDAFRTGQVSKLVIKDSIGAFGLNWQHCAHTVVFPSHSYERYYQCVRRFWRFGQQRPVVADMVSTEGGLSVLKNMQRKAQQADRMFSALVREMNSALSIERVTTFPKQQEVPAWLA
jgi:hypothetical protein